MDKGYYDECLQRYRFVEAMERRGGCLKAVVCLLVGTLLLCGCRTKREVIETTDSRDSVTVEYRERVVEVPVTVYVDVPAERQERETRDTTSTLATSLARSTATVRWTDGQPLLLHSLENIPQRIERTETVPVTEREKATVKTRRVIYTKTVTKEKPWPWWQRALVLLGYAGLVLSAVFFLVLWLHGRRPPNG